MTDYVRKAATLTAPAALKIMTYVFEHAEKNGWSVAVVILDAFGQTLMNGRMDDVSQTILSIAEDKAFTAALGKSTQQFYERMSSMPDLKLGLQNRDKLCAWPGGMPIYFENDLIGAIGVSGRQEMRTQNAPSMRSTPWAFPQVRNKRLKVPPPGVTTVRGFCFSLGHFKRRFYNLSVSIILKFLKA